VRGLEEVESIATTYAVIMASSLAQRQQAVRACEPEHLTKDAEP